MFNRMCFGALLLTGLAVSLTGCATSGGLDSISLSPNTNLQLVVGNPATIQMTATGTYGNGKHPTTQNITSQVTWSSALPAVATVSSTGLISAGVTAGYTTITATAQGFNGIISASVEVTVNACTIGCTTAEPYVSLTITPSTDSVALPGQTGQFIALGATSTGLLVNLTSQVAWSVTNASVATICTLGSISPCTSATNGLATGVGQGTTPITAIWTNPDKTVLTGNASFTVTGVASEPLQSLAITPNNQSVALPGQTSQLIAIGTFSSASTTPGARDLTTTVVWASSNTSVATITKTGATGGLVTAVGQGTTVITAQATNPDGSVVTATATFTVTGTAAEPLVSLAIVPAAQTLTVANQSANLIVIGTTSTGTTVNLTNQPATINGKTILAATWNSSVPSVAKIDSATGIATAGATAAANGTTAITAMALNPDGTVVTGSATLTVNISATVEPLTSLAIVPASQSVAGAGQTAQFLAMGTFNSSSTTPGTQNMADISTYKVAWYSSNPSVATICTIGSPAPCSSLTYGLATGVGQGTTAITAIATNLADQSSSFATATLTVTGASAQEITALSITPGSQTVTMPVTAPTTPTTYFVALGTLGSTGLQLNETNSVHWTSSNTAVATISNTGNNSGWATVVGQGTTTITATYSNLAIGSTPANDVTATATLNVNGVAAEPLLSMALLPATQTVTFPGETSQLIAIGTFSTAPVTQDLTNSTSYPIKWTSSNTSVATVSTAANPTQTCSLNTAVPPVVVCAFDPNGLVKAVGKGTAVITAVAPANDPSDGSVVTAVASFTVTNGVAEQVTALTIIPSTMSLSATGQPGQFVALGTSGTTGLQEDVTNSSQLAWSSSIPSYATITSGLTGGGNGAAQGASPGTTNITAEWTNPATSTTPSSVVTATASVTVTSTPAAEPLLSIVALPSLITDLNLEGTAQYLAYGTFSTAPTVLDITNGFFHAGFPSASCTAAYAAADAAAVAADTAANLPVTNLPYTQCSFVSTTWVSTAPYDFPVNSAGTAGATGGLSTADASGNTNIYAVASNPDSTLVYSPLVTFNCPYAPPTYATITVTNPNGTTTTTTDFSNMLNPGTCNTFTIADSLLTTLTVFNAGVNTSGWLLTAPSATGTPDVIHCGGTVEKATPEGSVCEATYPNGTPVILTATSIPAVNPVPAVNFGGWSSDCIPCTYNSGTGACPTTPAPPITATGPNYCTVQVGGGCTFNKNTGTYSCSDESNVSVGAIFN